MANGPQHGIMGDDNFGVDLPQMDVLDEQLADDQKKARFSKTAEFKELKDYVEGRVKFYQSVLPDGRPLTAVSKEDRDSMWIAANCIIGELNLIVDKYESAAQNVKEAAKRVR